ncbi:unnamed protein product, partial [Allacma fusca]
AGANVPALTEEKIGSSTGNKTSDNVADNEPLEKRPKISDEQRKKISKGSKTDATGDEKRKGGPSFTLPYSITAPTKETRKKAGKF